jgi:phage virion morphogenesis protein
MSMRIEVSFDDSKIQNVLSGIVDLGEDQSGLMAVLGSFIENSTKDRFETEITPAGVPWLPSRRAIAEGGKTLTDKGHLRDSITYASSHDEAVIGTNLIYAAIHQFGGTIEAKDGGKLKFAHSNGFAVLDQVTIPARPFFGLSSDDERGIEDSTADFLEDIIRAN